MIFIVHWDIPGKTSLTATGSLKAIWIDFKYNRNISIILHHTEQLLTNHFIVGSHVIVSGVNVAVGISVVSVKMS